MKTSKRVWSISVLICLVGFFVFALSGAVALALADEAAYYVCFSNQNYAVRNANKMTEQGGEYILPNVSLTSAVDFYVTDGAGMRWYGADNEPLSVEEAGQYRYDIKFSPDTVFGEETAAWERTDCHITYRFYEPNSFAVEIGGTPTDLTFNPYHTEYDLYYISSAELSAGTAVSFGTETHTVAENGYYRILFTPEKRVNNNLYLFDENGNYGSGDDFVYHIYIEDAPQYYAVFENVQIGSAPDMQIGEKDAFMMNRFEENIAAAEYRTTEFFAPERDYGVKYTVYERTVGGAFVAIDDDHNEDTAYSKLTATDRGWYTLSTVDGGNTYGSALRGEERKFGAIYLAAEENGYGFDSVGNVDLDDGFCLKEVEVDDDDYDEDYKQYILYLTVTEAQLREDDYEFFITDGKTKYKDGTEYIVIQTAGKYKILFSEEHDYGRGRNYQYVLEDGKKDKTELLIGTAQEFLDFAERCSASADYSVGLSVYLTADLDFADTAFTPVKTFSGAFYGGYHTLRNISYTETDRQNAVFITLTHTAVLERLNVENLILGGKDSDYVGLIGTNYGTVRFVTVTGTLTGRNNVGGIVAYNGRSDTQTGNSSDVINRATVEDCVSAATVTGESYAGGICGQNTGEIVSCTFRGDVFGMKFHSSAAVETVGGIAGYSIGKIYGCRNDGAVAGGHDSRYAGGIVGRCAGEIYFSFNYGEVSAEESAGGIVGYYGMRQTQDDGMGGIAGGSQNTDAVASVNLIDYAANYGNVTANANAGGIVGYVGALSSNGTARFLRIYNGASVGDITVTAGSYAGGIVGYGANAEIRSCASAGAVQAKGLNGGNYAGGIGGYCGSVSYSMSAATVKGENFVGGIAGYAVSSIIGCYTNVLLLPTDGAEDTGAIAGYSQAFQAASQEFGGVEGNYYVGNGGGIRGIDYAGEFNYAAAHIESATLVSDGMLSPLLCEQFSREYWQGGNGGYPTLRAFEEAEDCAEFDDETIWETLFGRYAEAFRSLTADASRVTYTVTFLEWNKDNGDLYDDDDKILHENFDIVHSIRVSAGQSFELPAFRYAEKNANGIYVYDGGEARYFVRFPDVTAVTGNLTVYAEYCEIATTVSDPEGKILAEGEFQKGTAVELIQLGDYYTLRFTYAGEEVTVGTVTVKFFAGDRAEDYSVQIVNGENPDNEISGRYVCFSYTDGDYFCLVSRAGGGLPFWAWLLIGIGSTVAAVGAAGGTAFFILRKRRKS